MKIRSSQRKSIATVPSSFTAQERRYAQSVSEAVDTLSGRRGNVIDRAVTFRDLLDTGILRLAGGILGGNDLEVINPNDPNGPDAGPTELPTKPSNLVATGGFDIVFLDWDLPPYNGHDYIEIFRYASDDIVAAEAAGAYTRYYGDTYFYTDTNVGSSETWYYWVRAVNVDGITGPFNSSTGTSATTALDYEFIAGLIDDSLSAAGQALGLNDTINALENDITTVETNVAGLTSTVTTLNTTVAGNSTSIQTNATSIAGIEGKYSVKIDNNGHISGFGLISTNNNGAIVSSFIVAADRFAIARPTWSTDTNIQTDFPFKVITSNTTINGASVSKGVYIDDAFIHNAQITTAKIQNLAVTDAKIEDLTATKITSGNIQITAANDIKIYQGKTFFNDNQSGFWLGLYNNAGSFHIGSSGTKYLKFDGNLGDLEASGLEIKASDGTVLVDAGGLRGAIGNNYAYNSHFNEGSTGWTTNGTIGSTVVFGYDYSAQKYYVETAAGYWVQTELDFPISQNEPIYVFGESYGNHGYYALVQYSSSGGTNGLFAIGQSGANAPSPAWSTNTEYRIKQFNVTQGYVRGRLRVGSQSGGSTTRHYFAGISTTPPVLDSSYAGTYIKSLYVTDLTGDVNTITSFDGSAFKTIGPSSAGYVEMFTVICEQNSQAAIYHEATISGCFSAKYATDTANIKLEWRARTTRTQTSNSWTSWTTVNILKQRSAGGGSSYMDLPFAGGTGTTHNVDVQFRVSVYMTNDNDNGTTSMSRSSTMEYSGTTIGVV